MNKICLKSYAKINLCLDVVNKRADGYHNLRTIMQSLDLSDVLEIKKNHNIHIECNHPSVPLDESNLAYKAAKAIFQRANISQGGASINIVKNIPVAAGLAGGSSNAAAVLHGINLIYNLNFTVAQLIDVGRSIGADVPYCLVGGTVLAAGIGDKLTILSPLEECRIVLVKPNQEVSTKKVYEKVNLNYLSQKPDIERAIMAIENNDLSGLVKSMGNVLEPITSKMVKEVSEIKNRMLEMGADGAHMCGSGPTVFAICSTKEKAESIFKFYKDVYSEVYLCKTI